MPSNVLEESRLRRTGHTRSSYLAFDFLVVPSCIDVLGRLENDLRSEINRGKNHSVVEPVKLSKTRLITDTSIQILLYKKINAYNSGA